MSDLKSTSKSTIEQNVATEVSASEVKDDSMGEFYQLRNNLLIGTILIALVGSTITWLFFSVTTSLNYLIGTGFGLVYLNMLVRDVEKIGPQKRGLGATRLAVFVVLMIVAFKLRSLEALPIFLGFMTYKVTILLYMMPLNLWGNLNKFSRKKLNL